MWYSILHCLVGSSAVAAALAIFGTSMIQSEKAWYLEETSDDQYEIDMKSGNKVVMLIAWSKHHKAQLSPILAWVVWQSIGIITAYHSFDQWTITEAIYFGVSSLSTGGLWAIPKGSSDTAYVLVGIFAAVGVPLSGMAMGNLASFFISDHPPNPKDIIDSPISETDLKMLIQFGLANNDLCVDRAEFVILSMVRLQVVDPDVVTMILDRFKQLDTSGDGVLDYSEVLKNDIVTQAKVVEDLKVAVQERAEETSRRKKRLQAAAAAIIAT
jgi:hypothetical protein